MLKRMEKELNIVQMGLYVMKEILSIIKEKVLVKFIKKVAAYYIQENGWKVNIMEKEYFIMTMVK